MKLNVLYSILWMLFFTQLTNAQISTSIPTTPSRANIEDFYGLNGQNTLSPTSMYFAPGVKAGLKDSKASYLRYPGGTAANYWDWQEGWFFRNLEDNGALSLDVDYQNTNRLTPVFSSGVLNESGSNYIQDFVKTLANTGTKPLFVVNPLTSDLNYQIAMLLEAKLQNLEVKRIEIGNEFYLSNRGYQEKFPTAQEYANLTSSWATSFKNYLGTDLMISAVGSNNDYTGSSNNRRDTWNSNLYNSMSGNLPEAFSIHHYRDALPPSTSQISYQTFFQKVIDDMSELNSYINQFGGTTSNTTPIWLTEYNLFDRNIPIHGTWYHGLYTAFSTLKLLENNRITACNLHAQSGNYVFGNFFNTSNGLEQTGTFLACNPPAPACSTSVYGKTSEGIAMEQVAIALKDAISGSRIDFSGTIPDLNPSSSNPNKAVYGWVFNENSINNASVVILNLSDQDLNNVNVSTFGFTSSSDLIQITLDDPNLYANGVKNNTGNFTSYNFVKCDGTTTSVNADLQKVPNSNIISLPKFSITRIKRNPTWIPRLLAQNDTIKLGSKVIVSMLNSDTIPFNWGNGDDSSAYIEVYPTADTTITLTYTIPGSITTSSVAKTIKVIQNPVAVSINSSSTSYCPGSAPINLGAIATGGNSNYKYIWITTPTDDDFPDFNKGVGESQSILVSPDYPTTYTVYVTDGTTVAKASITINVPTAFNLEPTYTQCSHTDISVNIASNAQLGVAYNYTWKGITYTISTTLGNPVNFTIPRPNISTSEFVTVNVSKGGCTTTKIALINFYNCCNASSSPKTKPGADVNDLETLLKTNLSYSISKANGELKIQCNGNPLIINGDFHVNDFYDPPSSFITDLELESCNVAFTEGASITVEPGFSLTLNNSNLDAACSQMWKGIIVNAGTLITDASTINGTSIKNAEIAINSYPGGSLNIRRTKFENNVVGIAADHQSVDGDNLQLLNFKANEFRGIAGAMKSPYIGQSLPVGNIPYAGMLLKLLNSDIGVPISEGLPNKFFNLNAGIICTNSTINIQNCKFSDMESDNAYLYPAGFSIFALDNSNINGSELEMEKTQQLASPSFGILQFEGSELNIQKSTFTNLDRAIQNDWSSFKNYNISENSFTDCKIGVEWWESVSENLAKINNNTFDASLDVNNHPIYPDLEAIHVFGGSHDFPFSIFENQITNHLVGVFAMNLKGKAFDQFIRNNQISLTFDEDYINSISFQFRGISLQNCDFIKVLQNDISWSLNHSDNGSLVEGIRFETCKFSLFSDNHLTNLQRGIYAAGTCEETALLCNNMDKCYPSGMYFDAVDLPSQGTNCGGGGNTWNGDYNSTPSYVYKIDEGLPNTPINWYFLGTNSPSNQFCPSPFKGNVILPQFATNLCFPEFPCGYGTNQERFYAGDSIIRKNHIEKIIEDSISYMLYPAENKYYDREYAVSVLLEDSLIIINNIRDQFLQAIDQENILKIKEVSELLKSGDINLAYIKNNSIIYQNIIDQNSKITNSILIDKIRNSDPSPFSSAQKNTLSTIAYQPSLLGGTGVFNARALLKLRIEDGASALRMINNSNMEQKNSNVNFAYPNPAQKSFHIKTSHIGTFDLKVEDLSGKFIKEFHNCSENTLFITSSLKSGLYILDLQFPNGKSEKLKLAIE